MNARTVLSKTLIPRAPWYRHTITPYPYSGARDAVAIGKVDCGKTLVTSAPTFGKTKGFNSVISRVPSNVKISGWFCWSVPKTSWRSSEPDSAVQSPRAAWAVVVLCFAPSATDMAWIMTSGHPCTMVRSMWASTSVKPSRMTAPNSQLWPSCASHWDAVHALRFVITRPSFFARIFVIPVASAGNWSATPTSK